MQSPLEIDVFLSRKSQDAHVAKEVYDFLVGHGLKVFNSKGTLNKITNFYNQQVSLSIQFSYLELGAQ
ncbi:MAG TPA: hypothetical protein VK169_09135 [Saprospiraceae bacterium]|nr:hypothetical protein [Saprospiraceae bacterium]